MVRSRTAASTRARRLDAEDRAPPKARRTGRAVGRAEQVLEHHDLAVALEAPAPMPMSGTRRVEHLAVVCGGMASMSSILCRRPGVPGRRTI